MKIAFTFMAFMLMVSASVAQPTTNHFSVPLGSDQVAHNTFSNDVWTSPWLETDPAIVSLHPNETYIANIDLEGRVTIDDGFFNGDESIHIGVDGEGGVGAAPATTGHPTRFCSIGIEELMESIAVARFRKFKARQGTLAVSGKPGCETEENIGSSKMMPSFQVG